MPSKEETLQQIADLNTKVDEQEARGLALINAKETTIAELNTLIDQLNARPEVPDDVTAALTTVRDNLNDNFATAVAPAA
jgi:uncharacterized protein YhaN